MNQQVICEHLLRVGLSTVIAENGKIGVEQVENRIKTNAKQFDLVFMDVHMPVMDGLEAAEIIHELAPDLPIVAMTANIMSHDRELYKNSHMFGYVGKPFTSQELWRCLMNYFTPLQWDVENETMHDLSERKLRQKLINNFVNTNQDRIIEIKIALSEGNIDLAHRLVHTLKSNAGQLKKVSLQQAAEIVESTLKLGSNDVTPEQMTALEKELDVVLAELEPMVEKKTDAPDPSKLLDAAASYELLKKIEPLIHDSDPECLEYVDDLKSVPGSGELIRLIDDFDFTTAADLLKELLDTFVDPN